MIHNLHEEERLNSIVGNNLLATNWRPPHGGVTKINVDATVCNFTKGVNWDNGGCDG